MKFLLLLTKLNVIRRKIFNFTKMNSKYIYNETIKNKHIEMNETIMDAYKDLLEKHVQK